VFAHISVLLSFVYALAITHVLASATDLIQARSKVRFSALHATWMLIAVLNVFSNWLNFWLLDAVHWTLPQICLLFAVAVIQYFTCSLVSVKVEEGAADMTAFFERQRPVVAVAYTAMGLVAMVLNYAFRTENAVMGAGTWVMQDLLIVPLVGAALATGFVAIRWVQWAATAAMLAMSIVFLAAYTLPA
jgi:hypothetical protein